MKRAPFLIGASGLILATALPAEEAPKVQPEQVDPARPDWENPAVNARGRMPASATHFPFESRTLALTRDPARSARYLSLDGAWHFALSPSADAVPAGFERPDYDVAA